MNPTVKTLYVVHHSHTDIGYTDLQEKVISLQASYIYKVLDIMKNPAYTDFFRWNCETYFCVEQFLKDAAQNPDSKITETFFKLVREEKIGFSATYLNFNDLLDTSVCKSRTKEMADLLKSHGISVKTAMFADINGISMGQRDVLIDNGVEFLYTNIHTHHGMYPLYKNQTPFRWENADGKRLLVWNGEHYNLGNTLGIMPNQKGSAADNLKPEELLHENLTNYVKTCHSNGYPYDFLIASVSGVFSDNAPPSTAIADNIKSYNEKYGSEIFIQMVSLQELYRLIKDKIDQAPVYRGDLTDWWAGGIGSTPYAVKHYREAQHMYHLCERLEPNLTSKHPQISRIAEDNLLLYAEHTWGHSASIIDPYDTMVLNLDMRKNSYASKAHEGAAMMLNQIDLAHGDIRNYYHTSGRIKVKNPAGCSGIYPVEFYIENGSMKQARITDAVSSEVIPSQISPHPRGVLISFCTFFEAYEEKEYLYEELPAKKAAFNTGVACAGAEQVRDIVNSYDSCTYRLPYEFENNWFYLSYEPYVGITGFINKKTGRSMLKDGTTPFFTPIYEVTPAGLHPQEPFGTTEAGNRLERERRNLGRNIRGPHALSSPGTLLKINCREHGDVFTLLELIFSLPGARHCSVSVKFYEAMPKIDFKLRLAKELCEDMESVYMPLSLHLPDSELYIKKGAEAFRPGIDQLPGTCMEFYMTDTGMLLSSQEESIAIESLDTPLLSMGKLKYHSITLCDRKTENNQRELYSWVMNNLWETNFKIDLSGFSEFRYSLHLFDETVPKEAFLRMEEESYRPHVIIIA